MAAFEKQTGIHGRACAPNDSIVLADQLLQEGSASPADVYLTENSPELVTLDQHGLLAPLARIDARPGPGRRTRADGRLGRGGAARQQPRLRPALISAAQLPTSVLDLAQPRWKGKIAIAPTDSDFPPLVGAVIATYGTKAAASAGSPGSSATPRSTRTTSRWSPPSTAAMSPPGSSTTTTGTGCGSSSAPARCTAALLLPRPQRRLDREHLRRRGARLEQRTKRDAQSVRRLPRQPRPRSRSSLTATTSSIRRGPASPNPALPPLRAISPATLGPVKLGNDQQAARLIEQSGLV